MTVPKVTIAQIRHLRNEFMEELLHILEQRRTTPARRWLKSHEVRRMLGISPNTLHRFRTKGLLAFSRVGGIVFYDFYDVIHMLEQSRHGPPLPRKNPNIKWKGEKP
jgi:hypothetical protein